MSNWTETNPETPNVIPESFADAVRVLFRQWTQCKNLNLAYQKQPNGIEGQEKLSALGDTLTNMILFARKIEEKFWWKMDPEDLAAFKDVITIVSGKMAHILQGKWVTWWDGEEFFLRFLHIANQIDQWTYTLSEVIGKVRWRVAKNSSGLFIL